MPRAMHARAGATEHLLSTVAAVIQTRFYPTPLVLKLSNSEYAVPPIVSGSIGAESDDDAALTEGECSSMPVVSPRKKKAIVACVVGAAAVSRGRRRRLLHLSVHRHGQAPPLAALWREIKNARPRRGA